MGLFYLFIFFTIFDVDMTAKPGVETCFSSSKDFCAFHVNSK